MILDGEEASSPSLVPAIEVRDRFAADLMVIFDGPIHSSGRPTIVYGARGIVTFNLPCSARGLASTAGTTATGSRIRLSGSRRCSRR